MGPIHVDIMILLTEGAHPYLDLYLNMEHIAKQTLCILFTTSAYIKFILNGLL